MAMTFALFSLIELLPEGEWVVPAIGGGVCLLAFLVGWRFLASRPEKPKVDSPEPMDARFLKGVNKDRRATVRRKGNTVEVQLSNGMDDEPVRGWVLDRSQGGLCLLAEQAYAPGAIVRVRPRKAAAATPWTDITIRSCRPEGGQFELGCQFHHTPNWSLLLLFG